MKTLRFVSVTIVAALALSDARSQAGSPAAETVVWRLEDSKRVGGHQPTVLGAPRVVVEHRATDLEGGSAGGAPRDGLRLRVRRRFRHREDDQRPDPDPGFRRLGPAHLRLRRAPAAQHEQRETDDNVTA